MRNLFYKLKHTPYAYFFLGIVLIRLVYVFTMGLMPQDAYYYYYSENLDFSYFDHPPMVAYFLKFFSLFFGKSVLAVKFTDFLITSFSTYFFYLLAKEFLRKEKAWIATILFVSTLLVTILSINTTPDVPLIFWWIISLIVIKRAISTDNTYYWILSGLSIGLAFLSKYPAAFLLGGLGLFFLLTPKYRKWLISYRFLLVLIFFFLAVSILIYWNVIHDWASFRFQLNDRASSVGKFEFKPNLFFGSLATQIVLVIPILYFLIWKFFVRFIKLGKWNDDSVFLLCFSMPILLFFLFLTPIYWVKLNWMIPGYISAIIFVADKFKTPQIKWQLGVSIFLHIILLIEIVFFPVNIESDDTWWGWPELNTEVSKLEYQYPDYFIFSDDGYKTTACLNFFNKEKIYAGNVIGSFALQYSLNDTNLSSLQGRSAIFLDSENRFKSLNKSGQIPEKLIPYFEEVEELDPILLSNKKGKVLRKFLVYKCKNYKLKVALPIK